MRVRQSMLDKFQTCPLAGKFTYIDLFPRRQSAKASMGTIIHYVLENYVSGMHIDSCVELFKELWAEPERLKVSPDYYPKFMTYHGLREQGIECLQQFHEKRKWEAHEVIATEHRFLVPIGEHELEGTVDLIEERKDGRGKRHLAICDYKTNSRQPTIVGLQFNLQFTCYIYASMQKEFWIGNGPDFPGMESGELLYQRYLNMPRRGVWIQLLNAAKDINAGERDDADFLRLYRLITEIEKAIKYDVFIPTINSDSCLYCDFAGPKGPCAVQIPEKVEAK